MENVNLDMKMSDPNAKEELKKLLDFLPDDDKVRTEYLNRVILILLNL